MSHGFCWVTTTRSRGSTAPGSRAALGNQALCGDFLGAWLFEGNAFGTLNALEHLQADK